MLRRRATMPITEFYSFFTPKSPKRRITRPLYESSHRAIIVEDTSGWRQLKRGEKDAGLLSSLDQVLISSWRCEVCGIGIGPGYNQEFMYLYPVYRQFINNPKSDEKPRFYAYKTLKVCGDCAAHPSRQLPTWLCVLSPEIYSTTVLLCEEGEDPLPLNKADPRQIEQVYAAIEDYINYRRYFIFLLHLLCFNVSLRWFFSIMAEKVERVQPIVKAAVKATTGLWKRITTPTTVDILAAVAVAAMPSMEKETGSADLDQLYSAIWHIEEPAFTQSAFFS